MVTADLLSRARAGDGEAFRELTGPHRRELQVHCYRMLGSFADAEDAVQDTMLAAWQGIGGFTEERASLRTWLYKIATNRCLNARRAASRRPARQWEVSQFEAPVPTPRDEPVWLQPFPDVLLGGAGGRPAGPEARYEQTEAISLAFVTALQLLPPRQVAVLILRDVLGFHASEVAGMLEATLESVNSALKRARASLQRRQQPAAGHQPPPAAGSPAEGAIVAKFARAWESADLDTLVALLTDDVFIAMPPIPFGYEGRDAVARYCAILFAGRRFDLVNLRRVMCEVVTVREGLTATSITVIIRPWATEVLPPGSRPAQPGGGRVHLTRRFCRTLIRSGQLLATPQAVPRISPCPPCSPGTARMSFPQAAHRGGKY